MANYSKRDYKHYDSSYKNNYRDPDRYRYQHSYSKYDKSSPKNTTYDKDKPLERIDRSPKRQKNDIKRIYNDDDYYSSKNRKDYGAEKKDYYTSSYKSTQFQGRYRDRSRSKRSYKSPSSHRDRRRSSRQRRNSRQRRSSRSSDRSSPNRRSRDRRYPSRSRSRSQDYKKTYESKTGGGYDPKWKGKQGLSSRLNGFQKRVDDRVHERRDVYEYDRYQKRDEFRAERKDEKRQIKRGDRSYHEPYYRSQLDYPKEAKYPPNEYQKNKKPGVGGVGASDYKKQYKQMDVQRPMLNSAAFTPNVNVPNYVSVQDQVQNNFQQLQTFKSHHQQNVSTEPPLVNHNIGQNSYQNKNSQYPLIPSKIKSDQSQMIVQSLEYPLRDVFSSAKLNPTQILKPKTQISTDYSSFSVSYARAPQSNFKQQICQPQHSLKASQDSLNFSDSTSNSQSQFSQILQKAHQLCKIQYPTVNYFILQTFRGFQNSQYQLQQVGHEWIQKVNQDKKNFNLHRAEFLENVKEKPPFENPAINPISSRIFKFSTPFSSKPEVDEKVSGIVNQMRTRNSGILKIDRSLLLLQVQIAKADHQKKRSEMMLTSVQ